MKHFLKGAAAFGITMMISMGINIICNKNGVELNSTAQTLVVTFCALLIYHGLTRNEK